jgi:hypothetical protein
MAWDPAVLRKYNSTGHFRLLNQVRAELKDNPLVRPRDGETVAVANRSKSLSRAVEARQQSAQARSRRAAAAPHPVMLADATTFSTDELGDGGLNSTFRERLNQIDMR